MSLRNPNDVSIWLHAYLSKYVVPTRSNIVKEMAFMSVSNAL